MMMMMMMMMMMVTAIIDLIIIIFDERATSLNDRDMARGMICDRITVLRCQSQLTLRVAQRDGGGGGTHI